MGAGLPGCDLATCARRARLDRCGARPDGFLRDGRGPEMAETVPVQLRTARFSVAYTLAIALFGGITPAVSTFLIPVTGNRAVAGLWLMLATACGLAALLLAWRPGFVERHIPVAAMRT